MRHSNALLSTIAAGSLLAACSSAPSSVVPDQDGGSPSLSDDAGAITGFDASPTAAPDASPPPKHHDAGAPAKDAAPATGDDAGIPTVVDGYTLVWSDEFNGADGTPPNPANWTHETGGNNANDELEVYSDSLTNSQQSGGNLVITATTDGQGNYTSARINTAGKVTWTYGRFEARAQMPYGQGMWPAIWMLGSDIDTVSWPQCGETDFMETIGTDVGNNHGSLHSPNWDPTAVYPLPNGALYSDAFHVFAVEWDPGEIRFYVDGALYETQDESNAPNGSWVFDNQDFFLIINLAVGGDWPGSPDGTTVWPQKFLVDYVRVYQKN
jgi:beta-glucanase (GH16 family)